MPGLALPVLICFNSSLKWFRTWPIFSFASLRMTSSYSKWGVYQNRPFFGIKPYEGLYQILFGHGNAPCRWRMGIAPQVEENSRPFSRNHRILVVLYDCT